MSWRLAKSLETLRAQVNAKWPQRSRDSDGSIGDEHHASRSSDHNPWVKDGTVGVVTAIDITHDPKGGFDSYAFADMLVRNRDPRIKYLISNRRIAAGSSGPDAWKWRHYGGKNPHDHHCHISCKSGQLLYDATELWQIDGIAVPTPTVIAAHVPTKKTVRKGDRGDEVRQLQAALHVFIDGDFGVLTEQSLKIFQNKHDLKPDGICGPQSWAALYPPRDGIA